MNDRRSAKPTNRAPRPDRSERLAAALRANLKRRKAQARGRAEPLEGLGRDEPGSDRPDSERKDR